jgi:hypothetical protein
MPQQPRGLRPPSPAAGGTSAAWTASSFVALVMIPFVDTFVGTSWFVSLPLYLSVELGAGLGTLGVVSGVVTVCRLGVPLVGSRCLPGRLEAMKVPLQLQCLGAAVCNLMFPLSLPAVYLNLYGICMLPQRAMFQAISVRVWRHDPTAALRVSESSYTVGYCLASLCSGAAYHYGGWVATVWTQVLVLSATLVLEAVVLPDLWPTRRCVRDAGARAPTDASCADDDDTHAEATHDSDWLCYFVCVGLFVFVFGYAAEWSIYALYFSRKFGFNTFTMGAGQMAGDVGGALLLLCTTSKPLFTRARGTEAAACGTAAAASATRLPFGMVWVALLYAATFVTFASDNRFLAMASQVVMGTLFVLTVQGVNELLLWLSWRGAALAEDGSKLDPGGHRQEKYNHFLAMCDVAYSAAVALGNFLPFQLFALEAHAIDRLLYGCALGIAAYMALYVRLMCTEQGA